MRGRICRTCASGLIAIAGGHQAAVSTLVTLRTIVHALCGWLTPFGAAIGVPGVFRDNACTDTAACDQIKRVGSQVAGFSQRARLHQPP